MFSPSQLAMIFIEEMKKNDPEGHFTVDVEDGRFEGTIDGWFDLLAIAEAVLARMERS